MEDWQEQGNFVNPKLKGAEYLKMKRFFGLKKRVEFYEQLDLVDQDRLDIISDKGFVLLEKDWRQTVVRT